MRASTWVFVAMVAAGAPAGAQGKLKDPTPQAVDVSTFRDQLRVFQDPQGGTYVVLGEELHAKATRVWYGPSKALYEQLSPRRSRNGAAWSIALFAPRIADFQPATIAGKDDGTFERACGHTDRAPLVELTGDKAKAVLDAAKFFTTATLRQAHMLARDDRGVYYYVDHLRDPYGGKGFRVLVGRKGALKLLPLVDVASDSEGEVFSTRTGNLRLVHGAASDEPEKAVWIKGKKSTDLVPVDIVASSRMIYRDLGVYKSLGTFCDNPTP
jgi:hypothetical protein